MSRNRTACQKVASLCQVVLVSALFCGAGCTSLGPRTVEPDRIDYNNAVAESWKQQVLLNIVRLRYSDAPVFIEVAQIIGGYTMEKSGRLGWGINEQTSLRWTNSFNVGGDMKFTDRPTITYTPLTGSKFIRNMMTPITPEIILFMIQSGWPADAIMQYTVQTINGLRNRRGAQDKRIQGDPDFFKLISLFRDVQASGAIGMQVEKPEKGPGVVNMIFRDQQADPEVVEKIQQIRKMLALRAGERKFRVTFGGIAQDDLNISLQTRSLFHILIVLASHVEVPAKHIEDGRVNESLPLASGAKPLIRVCSGPWKPGNAFAAARYGGYWYWIDRRDQLSKKTLAFMIMLFAIAEEGEEQDVPTVTISAG